MRRRAAGLRRPSKIINTDPERSSRTEYRRYESRRCARLPRPRATGSQGAAKPNRRKIVWPLVSDWRSCGLRVRHSNWRDLKIDDDFRSSSSGDAATLQASRSVRRSRGLETRGEAPRGHASAAHARVGRSQGRRSADRLDRNIAGVLRHKAAAACPHPPRAHQRRPGRRLHRLPSIQEIRARPRERVHRASRGCRAIGIAPTSMLLRAALRLDDEMRASRGRRWCQSPDPASVAAQRLRLAGGEALDSCEPLQLVPARRSAPRRPGPHWAATSTQPSSWRR